MGDTRRRRIGIAVTIAAIFATGAWLGTALADRSPTAPPLVYSGVILDSTGAPVPDSDTNSVSLSLYDGADSSIDTLLCPTITSSTVTTRGGNFALTLSAACGDVFLSGGEVWAHVVVNGTTIEPTQTGAVPYAVAAERVVYGGARGISEGLFCGYSADATTGAVTAPGGLVGYPATRALCQTACASSTAHICTTAELVRTASLGDMPVPPGPGTPGLNGFAWYAADAFPISSGVGTHCNGFTAAGVNDIGAAWYVSHIPGETPSGPSASRCDYALARLACCD